MRACGLRQELLDLFTISAAEYLDRWFESGPIKALFGFDGIVCTDWGLINDSEIMGAPFPARAWGVEHLTPRERMIKALDAGVDQFGGEACPELLIDIVRSGELPESRLDVSARRLLREKFVLGLFDEQRYVDVERAKQIVGNADFVAAGEAAQRASITLLTNTDALLPLSRGSKVYVEGMDTADDDKLYDIRQTVGMVFQSPDNQIVATVVEEDVAFALENLGVPPEEMRRRVDDAMKMAGIYEFRERAPHNLSGGQKQRVAIAGVVAMRPDCLILDEATAMLDPRGREQVMQTIHHLNKDLGITVVSITHYMEEAAQADRVLVMSQGNVVMEGTPKEVFSQTEKVRSLRLDVPQAAELRDELVKAGIPMPEGIIDTGECAQALYELLK